MKVSEVMTRGAAAVTPESALAAAARLMRDYDICAVPVLDGPLIVGILTARDIVTRALASGLHDAPVGKVMSNVVYCVEPDDDVIVAAKIMERERICRLPVVRNGELIGIVTSADLAFSPAPERPSGDVLQSPCPPSAARLLH